MSTNRSTTICAGGSGVWKRFGEWVSKVAFATHSHLPVNFIDLAASVPFLRLKQWSLLLEWLACGCY
eukprot:1159813-Pelagomonas_calceolata.AAC.28